MLKQEFRSLFYFIVTVKLDLTQRPIWDYVPDISRSMFLFEVVTRGFKTITTTTGIGWSTLIESL